MTHRAVTEKVGRRKPASAFLSMCLPKESAAKPRGPHQLSVASCSWMSERPENVLGFRVFWLILMIHAPQVR